MAAQPPNMGLARADARHSEARSGAFRSKALITGDIRTASAELSSRGYLCDRITHDEVMASTGTQYLGNLLARDYHMLRVATPTDWYVRLPGKNGPAHAMIKYGILWLRHVHYVCV